MVLQWEGKFAENRKIHKKDENFKSDARIYRLYPPLSYAGKRKRFYVVVSAADLHRTTGLDLGFFENPYFERYETFIFRCTRSGRILDWGELNGSFRGELNHEIALAGAGYIIGGNNAD